MGNTRLAVLLGVAYVLLFLLERAWPLRRPKARLLPRLAVNIVISVAAFAAAALLVQPAAAALLDLTFYYWHVANHRIGLLWRFHNVHHIDPDLDVSTAFRFHFVEIGFSAAFRAAQVVLVGPSIAAYVIYEVAFQLGTLFHHSNVRLPLFIERALNLLAVTPRMHGIHHSDIRAENMSDFGVVLSWWDRLHRTLRVDVPQDQVTIGIPGYAEPGDNSVRRCFSLPVSRQRDYWRGRLFRQ